jgi:hypothetical protein
LSSIATAEGVVNCLREDFLLSLPMPEVDHFWPIFPRTRNWRYLYCRHIARLLLWPERYREGDSRGIPAFLNAFLYKKQWPVFLDEARCEDVSLATLECALATAAT